MSYTYDPATDRGQVRLALGDASGADGDASTYVFEDAEIDAMLLRAPTIEGATVLGLRALLGSAVRRAKSFSLQGVSLDNTAQLTALKEQLEYYRSIGVSGAVLTTTYTPMPWDRGFSP